nr:DUF222 domain-containing protein [Mycobacteroides abscessus]
MFDTLGDGGLIDVIMSSQRAEAQAASCRLSAIGVFVDRHADLEREHPRDRFAVDRWDEVAAQVAAAQGVTHALASHQMRYAYVLRHRLRGVADRFAAGDIDFRTVALIIGRTEWSRTKSWQRWIQRSSPRSPAGSAGRSNGSPPRWIP